MGNLMEILRICFSANALVTGIVTIGLVTIITYISFILERKVSTASSFFKKVGINIAEMLLLLLMLLLVTIVFKSLTGGSQVELGGLLANAELTILFYGLFIFNNRLIILLNVFLPFLYHPSSDISRIQGPYAWLFIVSYLILIIVIDYLYSHKEVLAISNYRYLSSQMLFGICWWIFIWIDYRFPLVDIIGMLILFEFYMFVVRIIELKMSTYMHAYNDLENKVNYDALTGVRNRANLNKVSKEFFEKYSQSSVPLTVMMFDIDRFKEFNDHYGHEIGDEVLRHVSHTVERELHVDGSQGQLFRYGGEEFVILLKNVDTKRAQEIVNRINQTLIEMPLFIQGTQLDVTLCFGVTMLRKTDESFDEIFKRVDEYLYQSKNNGRDEMTIEGKIFQYEKVPMIKI
ncbi:GGDEF domain-containing protein [Companilactobacillus bobalius]|uniref:Diguanylate cyclase n=2 Tax=Companilactobacillus bobalius TaxID=2801451 RepID=A0A202FCS8_9LACO|nr:GGDEF domain-containing protein [Companilactobacillus bobalius]KRK82570.1 diguanylate cyclase phosphodiesterase domain-containing protein [Companilactobacillus bobalius DSM 19674]OVE98275.1 Diguanylate cyclase [Companilactobacillus bobalius]GEO58837.1 GGDEF domain-containing protein [Companilactobacillus paralimentarius]